MPCPRPRRRARHADPAIVRSQRRRSASGARRCRRRNRSRPASLRRYAAGRSVMTTPDAAPTATLPRRRGRGGPAPQAREGGGYPAAGEPTPAAALAAARRLVVKIGSALLVDEDGEIHRAWLDALVDDLARCRGRNQDVIVVSSGAIA